jgi:hypothetical protein
VIYTKGVPAKRAKEHSLLARFLRAYEKGSWADADLDWVDEHLDGAVEVIATRRSDGATLAIEHTVIQPHPKEKEDFARFSRSSFVTGDRDPSIEIPQSFLYVNLPIGTLQRGQDWNALADEVRECIRQRKDSIPDGRSELRCVVGGNEIALKVELVRDQSQHECRTIMRRYGDFDVRATVRTALKNKLPKLAAAKAQKRLLMFERDQWHLDHDVIATQIEHQYADFPQLALIDEVWLAETHDNRHIVLFDPVVHGRGYSPVYTFRGDTLHHRSPGY